jgi:outer membrane protein assembly factor BamB
VDDMDNIVAINATNGLVLWKSKLVDFLNAKERKKSRYWNAPIVANKNVYILSSNGELLSFDTNGKFIKVDYKMGLGSYLPPIYAGEKAVIISSK